MLALLLSIASLSSGEPARKGYFALADMVDRASFVCIGRVEEVLVVVSPEPLSGLLELPIARVAVERVLKGDKGTTKVFHEAWGTWTCDTTDAEIGERALFVLGTDGEVARASEAVQARVRASLGTATLLRNIGSGDGIVRIALENGEEVVYCRGAPRAFDSERVRYAEPAAKVLDYIEQLARFALDEVSVHARSGDATLSTRPSGTFDLRILPDGEARLARALGAAETVQTSELDPQVWSELRERLLDLAAGQQRSVGEEKGFYFLRKLTIRSSEGSLTLSWPRDWTPHAGWERDASFAPAFADALRAWAFVDAVIDCRECDDYAESDRLLLERTRR